MEFKEVNNKRKSVRGFLDEPVSKEVLSSILKEATRAVNGKNIQPWEFLVVTGKPLEELKEINGKLFRDRAELDNPDFLPEGVYKERSKELGIGLFKAADIGREDKEKRIWWGERGYRFFDAPAVILIMMDENVGELFRLDIGCVVQNICLAAVDAGLATCVEYQATGYNAHYYEKFGIEKSKKFIVGIAIGKEDPEFPANAYISNREDVDVVTKWAGF